MLNDKEVNSLRGISFVFNVLLSQQYDPFCSKCLSFVKSAETAREKFLVVEKSVNKENLPEELKKLFSDIYPAISALELPENPAGQKKAGNCKLPEGVCFPKSALAVYEKVAG
jgi:hypothetical protein